MEQSAKRDTHAEPDYESEARVEKTQINVYALLTVRLVNSFC